MAPSPLSVVTPPAADLPSRVSFLDAQAKARIVAAVIAFEQATSAELMVTVKKRSRAYLEADLAWGSGAAFVALLVLLFSPTTFHVALMPLDVALGFGFGFGLSRMFPAMSRVFVSEAKRREAVEQAAKAAFYNLGVSRTTGRTGVLLYLSVREAMVVFVTDTGITVEAQAAALRVQTTLEKALARLDVEAFAQAVESLGSVFASTMPRDHDDINELSDEVS